jgi:hypothetical protein
LSHSKESGVLVDRRQGARRWVAAAVGAGLAVLELALVRLAGPPGRQVEVLRQLGEVGADPLASLLALLALAAEGLAAYLLAVLGLRLLASVPGAVGRLGAGATVLAAPATVRRALDLLSAAPCWRRRPSRPSPPAQPPLPRRRPPGGPTHRRPGGRRGFGSCLASCSLMNCSRRSLSSLAPFSLARISSSQDCALATSARSPAVICGHVASYAASLILIRSGLCTLPRWPLAAPR